MKILLLYLSCFYSLLSNAALSDGQITISGRVIKFTKEFVEIELGNSEKIVVPRKYTQSEIKANTEYLSLNLMSESLNEIQYEKKSFTCEYLQTPTIAKATKDKCTAQICTSRVHCGSPMLFAANVTCEAKEGKCPTALECYSNSINTVPAPAANNPVVPVEGQKANAI